MISPARTAGHTRWFITLSSHSNQKAANSSSSFPAAADAAADAGADASHCVDARATPLEELCSLLVSGIALTGGIYKDGDFRYTSSAMMDGGHFLMLTTHFAKYASLAALLT